MIMLVDIGNTRIKWAIQANHSLQFTDAFTHRCQSELPVLLDKFWRDLEDPDTIVISNVAGPNMEQQMTDWCKQTWGVAPHFVSVQAYEAGIKSHYCLESLGVDRWLALLALSDHFDLPAIVVDCGSAVTADALDENKVHPGGLIMPGLSMMRMSLHHDIGNLPVISGVTESRSDHCIVDMIGEGTVQAISCGTLHAICGMIDRFIIALKQNRGFCPDSGYPTIVLTGGDAEIVANALDRPVVIEPQLVLLGLMQAAKLDSNFGKHQAAKNQRGK